MLVRAPRVEKRSPSEIGHAVGVHPRVARNRALWDVAAQKYVRRATRCLTRRAARRHWFRRSERCWHLSCKPTRSSYTCAVASMIPIATKYVARRSPRAPAVLALEGVDTRAPLDGEGGLAALRSVLDRVAPSEERTRAALSALRTCGEPAC